MNTLHSIESGPEFTLFLNTCALTQEVKFTRLSTVNTKIYSLLCEQRIFSSIYTRKCVLVMVLRHEYNSPFVLRNVTSQSDGCYCGLILFYQTYLS